MKMYSRLCAAAAAAVMGMWAQQPAKPNLSGTWRLDVLRSRFDAIPAPKSEVLKIEQQDPKIHIVVDTATKRGETNESFDLTTDGTEQKVTVNGQSATASALWDDPAHLLLEVKRDTPDGPEVITRRMHVGEKGKIMTSVLTIKDKAGMKTAYGFFVKE